MWIRLDSKSSLPLSRQIHQQIKKMILEGILSPNEKLPSTRMLAGELQVSRNTVMEAYNQLIAEGYLEGRHGSGTIVAACIPDQIKHTHLPSSSFEPVKHLIKESQIDFRSGVPDLSYFPRKEWGRLYYYLCCDLKDSSYRYHSPAGVFELRAAISHYLNRTRGIVCNPHNVMIVSGATQGLSLISGLLYHPDKQDVIVEDPTHPGLRNVITENNYHITGIPVDAEGIRTDLLPSGADVSFLYTTPSHQYPMGGILPLTRRIALVEYALEHNCYLVEDDYDSEFRFESQPINSLYELSPSRVIYIGSFSKILAPAIRLGFLLLPDELMKSMKRRKQYTDVHSEAITQYTLAQFIENGSLEKHIWKMKKLYNKKRNHLIKELQKYFIKDYHIYGQAAGLHIVIHFDQVVFTEELVDKLNASNIKIYPVANYSLAPKAEHQNEIIMGYAHLTYEDISNGVRLMKEIITFEFA